MALRLSRLSIILFSLLLLTAHVHAIIFPKPPKVPDPVEPPNSPTRPGGGNDYEFDFPDVPDFSDSTSTSSGGGDIWGWASSTSSGGNARASLFSSEPTTTSSLYSSGTMTAAPSATPSQFNSQAAAVQQGSGLLVKGSVAFICGAILFRNYW